jgi:hypothetical protein
MPPSYAWRGPRGCGKRTQLLDFLRAQLKPVRGAEPTLTLKHATWYLNKQVNGGDPDEDDDDPTGKSIPYEESPLHLGFDVATMSMSDKVFLQSILSRWTGQQDVCLLDENRGSQARYLVLYHAHYLTDESVLQLQECLEQYPSFAVLLTTELPLSGRLRDACFEIPCAGGDRLLANYVASAVTAEGVAMFGTDGKRVDPSAQGARGIHALSRVDVWQRFFRETLQTWSLTAHRAQIIVDVRNWIYVCLQRNLRWTDVMMYWLETIYTTPWLNSGARRVLMEILWRAESGAGWVLVTSYRIPILWEHVHLKMARELYRLRVVAGIAEDVGCETVAADDGEVVDADVDAEGELRGFARVMKIEA